MTTTRLKSLNLYAHYGREGYRCSAEFTGDNEVKLQLDDKLANKIVELCAREIVSEIQAAALSVTVDSVLHGPEAAAKELEHQGPSE